MEQEDSFRLIDEGTALIAFLCLLCFGFVTLHLGA